MQQSRRAFTLVEVMIALAVISMFLVLAYRLFIGGQKVANKGTWTAATVDRMRNALTQLNNSLKSTSYPTTLLSDAILDPTNNTIDVAKQFFVKIPKTKTISASAVSGTDQLIMTWVVCEPERPPAKGVIVYNRLSLKPVLNTMVKVGELWIDSKACTFATNPNSGSSDPNTKHAQSGILTTAEIPVKSRKFKICDDVEEIRFTLPGTALPILEPQPIKIEIRCQFPKDPKTFKENSIMITPNVGIDYL